MLTLSRRGFLATAAGGALLTASDAKAWLPHGAPSGQTLTIQQTREMFVSLKTWLDTIPDENDITATVTGSVALKVWPYVRAANVQASGSRTWVKRELYPFTKRTSPVVASTSSASVGAGAGTHVFSAKTGAGETGSVSTFTITYNVTSAPELAYSLGQRTWAGYGGFPLGKLPGSPGNKSITSQSTPGALAIFTQSNCISWAGTFGSKTRTVGTPTLGAAAYSCTVHDSVLSQNWTITFDVNTDELNIAVDVGGDSAGSSQLVDYLTDASTICYGDFIVCEGNIVLSGLTCTVSTTLWGTNPATSVTAPTSPINERSGWNPNGICTANAGWVTIMGRDPISSPYAFSINTAGNTTLKVNRSTNNPFYLNFHNMLGGIYPENVVTTGYSWVMYSFSDPQAPLPFNWQTDAAQAVFMFSNYTNGGQVSGSRGFTLSAQDSWMVGNFVENIYGDHFDVLVYNATQGSGRSHIDWNVAVNSYSQGEAHIDTFQPSTNASSAYQNLAGGSTVDLGTMNGNITYRGNGGTNAGDGTQFFGTQNFFFQDSGSSTTRDDIKHVLQFVGNVAIDINRWGIALPPLADGSVIANNLTAYAMWISPGAGGPGGWQDGSGTTGEVSNQFIDGGTGAISGYGPSSSVLIARNIRANTVVSNFIDNVGTPTQTNNYLPGYGHNSVGDVANFNALFTNPTALPATTQTVEDIRAAWTPKAGTYPLMQSKLVGPFAPGPLRKLDHRRWTIDASLLV